MRGERKEGQKLFHIIIWSGRGHKQTAATFHSESECYHVVLGRLTRENPRALTFDSELRRKAKEKLQFALN